ncbi:2-polyprenyl-3-methyl-5-hydroxy-6-metoxy-1,4-benzoquinol methylase [Veronia nyctiphanis]|uniref:2-polyprenyl-3-methyl-5-hydroxy-6-metoxy-1, 4-benzoquinol methylase n=1 Tax=Veronia nyctiphanis TaxID=1278244 RepID=A0A4Q0YPX8_9GAMM|nr:class I SAM-dependent methyltransferase [Veronia nyctiphanis]RXJ72643.1 2-polyprenyl-3-methyl-5-hydroxy-6-metoxy-1,4-benzoquinol methylase [Veronia nyctiphanis]
MSHTCPLCASDNFADFHQDKRRRYFRCGHCFLVFVDPASFLSADEEKAIYQQHENSPDDVGYRQFLSRIAEPLHKCMPSAQSGLDFGCGPGPTLSLMLEDKGHSVALYDPFFVPDGAALNKTYDFVTCTEAIEHFHYPKREWGQLISLIKPGGWLALMTKLVKDAEAFSRWHYKNDPTHVSFFSRETFRFLADRDGLDVDFVGNDVILLRKKTA